MTLQVERIGNATLYLGDCREILPTLPKVDALVFDPPYGIALRNGDVDGHRSRRSFQVAGDEDQSIGMAVLEWAEECGLTTIAFASPSLPWPGQWRNLIAWDKGGAVGGGGDVSKCLKRSWELIQVARNGEIVGPRSESVWRHTMTPADTEDHICAKPVVLMERLIRTFTRGLVLDACMGSGTTGVACMNLGRSFIGIEIDPGHFETACRRIEDAQRQGRLIA